MGEITQLKTDTLTNSGNISTNTGDIATNKSNTASLSVALNDLETTG